MKKNNLVLKILLVISFIMLIYSSLVMFKTPTDNLNINGTSRLKSGDVIKQKHHFSIYNLKQLIFREATFGEFIEKADFDISLYDDNDNLLVTKNYVLENFPDGRFISFPTNNLNLDGDYYIEIKINKLPKDANFNIYTTTTYEEFDSFFYNGKEIKGVNIGFVISGYQKTYFYTWIIMFIFIIISIIYLIKTNIKKEKILKFLSSKIAFTLYIGISLAFSILFFYGMKANTVTFKRGLAIIFSSILAFIILLNIITYIKKKDIKVEKLFLYLAIPLGFMYTIYIMPFEVPDTHAHYMSAYQPIVGNFNKDNNLKAPKVVTKTFYNRQKDYQEFYDKILEDYDYNDLGELKAEPYNFLEYIPSTIGLFIGKMINVSPYVGMYIAKFLCLFTFLIIGYFVIKLMPFGKYVMLVYMLNPMLLQQATSLSVDATINNFSLLFIAYMMKLKCNDKKITYKDIIILAISLLLASVQKVVYIFLGLLVFTIFKKLKKMNFKKWVLAISLAAIVIAVILIWYLTGNESSSSINNGILSTVQYASSDPLRIFYVILNSIKSSYDAHITQSFGLFLGWTDTKIPTIIFSLYIAAIVFALLTKDSENKPKFNKFDTFILIIICLIVVCSVNYALYSGWTYIGTNIINGVQGRYYIPIFILILLYLYNKIHIKIDSDKTSLIIIIMLITVNIFALLAFLSRY